MSLLPAGAHEIVGNRTFPATLAIDDPGVSDELALPTVAWSRSGDDPSFKQLDVSAEFSKRITEDWPSRSSRPGARSTRRAARQ
jgi:hypothetical protein